MHKTALNRWDQQKWIVDITDEQNLRNNLLLLLSELQLLLLLQNSKVDWAYIYM